MNLSCGLAGLPNVGKSTLFNSLLKRQVAASANFPFTTIEPNVGVVEVPDERLEKLADVIAGESNKEAPFDDSGSHLVRPPIVPAVVRFVDIAGLVKGAAQGEGLGNQFLSHIRGVDVIVFVLRDFRNEDIVRAGSESPQEDLEVLKSELLLKDLETLTKRIDSFSREVKSKPSNDPGYTILKILAKSKSLVEQGKWLRDEMNDEELDKVTDLQLLSCKKTIYVINSDEGDLQKPSPIEGGIRICAKLEEELGGLSEGEQKDYLKELGLEEPGLNRLIKKAYETLGLVTFFTAGPKEVRAWTIKSGMLAPQAAGVIHSDFERGFIAAEVIDWKKLVEAGSWQNAKNLGLIRSVGRDEIITDGLVVEFKSSL